MSNLRTQQTLKWVSVDARLQGDNVLIDGVSKKRILAYKWRLTFTGPLDLTWKSGSTALSGPMPYGEDAGDEAAPTVDQEPWYQTEIGQPLVLNLSEVGRVAGTLYYKVE